MSITVIYHAMSLIVLFSKQRKGCCSTIYFCYIKDFFQEVLVEYVCLFCIFLLDNCLVSFGLIECSN